MTQPFMISPDCRRTIQDIQTLQHAISDASAALEIFMLEAGAEHEYEVASVRIFRLMLHMIINRADLLLARVEHRRQAGPFLRFHDLLTETSNEVSTKLKLVESSSPRQPATIKKAFADAVDVVRRKLPEFKGLESTVSQLLSDKQRLLDDFSAQAELIEIKLTQTLPLAN